MSGRCRLAIHSGPEALAVSVARDFVAHVDGRSLSVALSGGRIAPALFGAIVREAAGRDLGELHFHWADERCVPLSSPESNYRLAREHLLSPLGIAPDRQHPFATREEPREIPGARMSGEDPRLDLVLLGMGEDGHVASLFPENLERDRLRDEPCFRVRASKPPPERITLGYSVLARARQVWVLVSGAGKEESLRPALRGEGNTPMGHLLSMREFTRIETDVPLQGFGRKTTQSFRISS